MIPYSKVDYISDNTRLSKLEQGKFKKINPSDVSSFNSIVDTGFYFIPGYKSNNPPGPDDRAWYLQVYRAATDNVYICQQAIPVTSSASNSNFYVRYRWNDSWSDWMPLYSSTWIPENTDLNNLRTVGMFYCATSSSAGTMLNTPVTRTAFSLFIEKHAGVKQTFTTFTTSSPHMYIRNYYSSGWGGWFEVTLTAI